MKNKINIEVAKNMDVLNALYAYVGQYNQKGLDSKNRLPVPSKLVDILTLRKEALGLDDKILYYTTVEEGDEKYLMLKDHLLRNDNFPEYEHAELDGQRRILLRQDSQILSSEFIKSLVASEVGESGISVVGYGDHIRVYSGKKE